VKIKITVFWDVAPCSLVEWFRRFEKTCFLHLQCERGRFKSTRSQNQESRDPAVTIITFCTYKEMFCGIINNFTNGRSNECNSSVCILVHACSYHRRQKSSASTRQTGLRAHGSPHSVFSNIFPLVSCDVIIFGLNASNLHCMFYFNFDFYQPKGNCHYYVVNFMSAK
jgi:hypothetical protein